MSYSTLSIDWEDFGQLLCMYHFNKVTEPVNAALERQTSIMLDMMDETNCKATFFILGVTAKYRPGLVKKIASKGHEIAIHGQNHIAMFTLTPDAARKDLQESIDIVTQITGEKIYGYRAPFFSVNETNLWLLDILADLGIEYDSSIFPKKMPRYGIEGFSDKDALYDLPNGKQIVELPLTVACYFNKTWPVSGGGYIRLMPKFLVNKIFNDFENLCFVGHSHIPGVYSSSDKQWYSPKDINHQYIISDDKAVINIGSVGQPRDEDTRACYGIFDGSIFVWRRVEYNIQGTVNQILEIDEIDNFMADRLLIGR